MLARNMAGIGKSWREQHRSLRTQDLEPRRCAVPRGPGLPGSRRLEPAPANCHIETTWLRDRFRAPDESRAQISAAQQWLPALQDAARWPRAAALNANLPINRGSRSVCLRRSGSLRRRGSPRNRSRQSTAVRTFSMSAALWPAAYSPPTIAPILGPGNAVHRTLLALQHRHNAHLRRPRALPQPSTCPVSQGLVRNGPTPAGEQPPQRKQGAKRTR